MYCRYLSVSACISCLGPLGHGIHHSVPKTHSRDPAPGGGHSGHPRACALPLYDPIQAPTLDPIFRFFLKNPCLALSCHGHRIGLDTRDRPKLGPIVLPRAWNRTRLRVLNSDIYLWPEGASKMPPSNNFVFWSVLPRP